MTIDEMIETFEALCVVHSEVGADAGADYPATDMTRAPTNERYLRVTSGGIRDIGEPIPLWFTDPDHAMFQWLNEAKACIEDYGKQLYWRDKPELVTRHVLHARRWRQRGRLAHQRIDQRRDALRRRAPAAEPPRS